MLVYDYFSKWFDIKTLKNKTANEVILKMKELFTIHGIPEKVVADNVPYSSIEFKEFAKDWEFEMVTTSPIYSQSNGFAEKRVDIAKTLVKKCMDEKIDWHKALLNYRNTPVAGLDASPAQILMSRQTRNLVPTTRDNLKPIVRNDIRKQLKNIQNKRMDHYNKSSPRKSVQFCEDESIYLYRNKKWEPAIILKKHDTPRSYFVKPIDGQIIRRNTKFLRKRTVSESSQAKEKIRKRDNDRTRHSEGSDEDTKENNMRMKLRNRNSMKQIDRYQAKM